MSSGDISRMLHDLRSPLARAKTVAKLLDEASPEERADYLRMLLSALEEMDQRMKALEAEELH